MKKGEMEIYWFDIKRCNTLKPLLDTASCDYCPIHVRYVMLVIEGLNGTWVHRAFVSCLLPPPYYIAFRSQHLEVVREERHIAVSFIP